MTNSLIPYSFVPGTKAKAQEVNANFIALAEQIQTNNTNLTGQISDLETNFTNEINEINENSLDHNLANTYSFTNTILEAPNGVAEYESATITVKSGVKVLIPNGRTDDNKLNSIEYTTSEEISKTMTEISSSKTAVFLYNDGTIQLVNQKRIFYKNTTPTTLEDNVHWYNIDENKWYKYISSESRWEEVYGLPIANAVWNSSNIITSFTASQPINLVKASDLNNFYTIKGILPADLDYIVEKYKAGNAFYLLYKSGWIRQGGYLEGSGDSYANYYYPMATGVNPMVTRLSGASTTSSIPIWVRDNAAGNYMKIYSGSSTSKFWTAEGYITNPEEV